MFELPNYIAPDFSVLPKNEAVLEEVEQDGVAPEYFHSTSMFPEYFYIEGKWLLAEESRMDSCVIYKNGKVLVVEARNLKKGDKVILGRSEEGEEGIYVHTCGFVEKASSIDDKFVFRQGRSRETAFSRDYDKLYELLKYEKENGNVLFVMGPAVAFDHDSRDAMQYLIENGYCDGLLAGNALATHDLEAAYFKTALGQNVYTQESVPNGHYNHLDVINKIRRSGSIPAFIEKEHIDNGIIYAMNKCNKPFVLCGSIRDDGPLPEVVAIVYVGQSAMRSLIMNATTIICLARLLLTIAAGNITPSFRVVGETIRPIYIYSVDISEFATNKLKDRGSLSSTGIITNVQDFIVNVAKGLGYKS